MLSKSDIISALPTMSLKVSFTSSVFSFINENTAVISTLIAILSLVMAGIFKYYDKVRRDALKVISEKQLAIREIELEMAIKAANKDYNTTNQKKEPN